MKCFFLFRINLHYLSSLIKIIISFNFTLFLFIHFQIMQNLESSQPCWKNSHSNIYHPQTTQSKPTWSPKEQEANKGTKLFWKNLTLFNLWPTKWTLSCEKIGTLSSISKFIILNPKIPISMFHNFWRQIFKIWIHSKHFAQIKTTTREKDV